MAHQPHNGHPDKKPKNPHQHRIEVILSSQTLKAFDGPTVMHTFDCITGDADHPTDKGTFHVFLRDKTHVSSKYHVQMNYALFFTHDGKAIHQYHGPAFAFLRSLKLQGSDWVGSHGCVRLMEDDARTLYSWAHMNTTIVVKK